MKRPKRIVGTLALLLLTAAVLPAQRQWRQVYKAASQIQSIKIIRPLDTTIAPSVYIDQGSVSWNGPFCLRYHPNSDKLDTVGPDIFGKFVLSHDGQYREANNIATIWMEDAPYDTSRHVSSVVSISESGWWMNNSSQWQEFGSSDTNRLILTGNVIDSSCELYLKDYDISRSLFLYKFSPNQKVFFHPVDGTVMYGLIDSGLTRTSFGHCPDPISSWPIVKRALFPDLFFIDQEDPMTLIVGARDTTWRSTDGGETWMVAVLAHLTVAGRMPHSHTIIAASSDSVSPGVYVSESDGTGFHRASFATPVYSLDVDHATGIIYVGTRGAIMKSSDGGNNFTLFDSVRDRDAVIGVAAIDGRVLYADSGGVYETDAPSFVQEALTTTAGFLVENYPNPFLSSTTITINNNDNSHNRIVSAKIYDSLGREITDATSLAEQGRNTFVFNRAQLPPGIYECRIQVQNATAHTMMLVLK